ncbi:4-hydroxy-tetrahydrodipicolinate synthase [Pullulanibacillus pueri]|uniref:4-hydroxy-tetrahydrodipicolinate synthase n=1 Tax=Pullulanibacillus pueri TaxID=1437324 RepID=A0A8J2ZWL5_9BACL|nr:4-hydroxy-tetrahydrodipicolinate synthase [Pullulanibacillus pueri]MBM7682531.1 4-hydroxy-tetrahydrodipicolinate synthase [Pullulanibacillus pueri]GGH82029.1 4-hydroxy-tetrahydrodipicolinate synthase [Pullulanibacillus pueri]
MVFGRLLTAMVTPFDQHGEVDEKQIKPLVDHLIHTGTEGLVVSGTTGESPTLSKSEKLALFEMVLEATDGRVPVIAGTGSNNTADTVALTKEVEKLGVEGVLLVSPYYSKPNQSGLYEHFKTIAQSVHIPIMLYNVPGRTASNLEADTVVKLAALDNVVCIKEASGDLSQMAQIIERTSDDFVVYSGDDALTLPVLSIGGYGVVSVASHVVGQQMQQMIHDFIDGNVKEAAQTHRLLLPIMKQLFAQPSPVPVKALLNQLGVSVGGVRLPLVGLSDTEQAELSQVYQQFTDKFSE